MLGVLQFYGACLRDPQSAMLIMELCEVRASCRAQLRPVACHSIATSLHVYSVQQAARCWLLFHAYVGPMACQQLTVPLRARGATCGTRCRRTRALPGTAPGSTSRWTWRGDSTSCTPAASSTGGTQSLLQAALSTAQVVCSLYFLHSSSVVYR